MMQSVDSDSTSNCAAAVDLSKTNQYGSGGYDAGRSSSSSRSRQCHVELGALRSTSKSIMTLLFLLLSSCLIRTSAFQASSSLVTSVFRRSSGSRSSRSSRSSSSSSPPLQPFIDTTHTVGHWHLRSTISTIAFMQQHGGEKDYSDNDLNIKDETVTRPSRRAAALRLLSTVMQNVSAALRPHRRLRKAGLIASMALVTSSLLLSVQSSTDSTVAHAASAPVMALPKAEGRDPVTEAMGVHERKLALQAQQELNEMAATARRIEAQHGEAARLQYERDYKVAQTEKAVQKQAAVLQLKRDLLDQGICPFCDLEGQRQVILLEKGVDLAKIPGTPFYLEQLWEQKSPSKSMRVKKAANRRIVACMVQDMKNRDIDAVDYFGTHQEQTEAILDMKPEQALRLLQQYEMNLEQYGQITVPKEGEVSAKDIMAKRAAIENSGANQKKLAKERAALEKAAAKEKADEAKRSAQAEKARIQAEAKAAKQAAKDKEAAAAFAARAAQESSAAASTVANVDDELSNVIVDGTGAESGTAEDVIADDAARPPTGASVGGTTTLVRSKFNTAMAAQAGAAIVAVGGGAFAVKVYRDNAATKEEERQRQFRLLMNGSGGSDTKSKSAPPLEEISPADIAEQYKQLSTSPKDATSSSSSKPVAATPVVPPPAVAAVEAPKKKGLGLKNVFKKKSGRETDLMALVRSGAAAPAWATTLAQALSLGAPGRFPAIRALPGANPQLLESTNGDLSIDEIASILEQALQESGLTRLKAVEVFADVVNCMLIQMVDLASSSLKEKDDQLMIDAMSIVVDFMNHAAALYDAIADGIIIKPVTYGGDLSKSKLEQMYTTYATSPLLSIMDSGNDDDSDSDSDDLPKDFENRASLLREVFEINEKKAEGLQAKAMQKSMTEMMKTGKGMEKLQKMMQGMGGMDGMDMNALAGMGLGGPDGQPPTHEELMQMLTALKQMKDSGKIPPAEFDAIKKQFQDAFGASINDVVSEADANQQTLSEADKELVELMKSIMAD